ncbi:hypothetical protein SAMN02799630_01570 [Paenibacillus sp. UNCCL117]|uniref:hypothetical protein n=1 Tax=unclassified Paenibacillus TaxID=185978 RepID=UPI00087F4209|nr:MULTISPECIES: hypothetical protein [unclassified Paenibacillus]SDC87092.1 hypothetical protein SAMN04488602_10455 [Paenibacillus sp. cl123]SFW27976.1 hypothetical protein SAMN02799630_01570 [Paenibacillus sp. UNCCL117]
MSMRAVEMQFALHKNDEAGFKQQQIMSKPVQDQAALSQESEKQLLRQRRISAKTEEANRLHADRDGGRDGSGGSHPSAAPRRTKGSSDGAAKESVPQDAHPFKGHHIDISL